MSEMVNLVICGASRSGKTTAIRNMILETLLDDGLVFVTDFKILSYKIFEKYLRFLGSNDFDFYKMIQRVKVYYDNRLELLLKYGCDKWQDFVKQYGDKYFKEILVVVDEMSLMDDLKKANKELYKILNVCSCCRIRFVIGVQRADNEVITTKVRTNCEILTYEVKNENDRKLIGVPDDYEFLKYLALNVNTLKEYRYSYMDTKEIQYYLGRL